MLSVINKSNHRQIDTLSRGNRVQLLGGVYRWQPYADEKLPHQINNQVMDEERNMFDLVLIE
jgi:hypothetical protein